MTQLTDVLFCETVNKAVDNFLEETGISLAYHTEHGWKRIYLGFEGKILDTLADITEEQAAGLVNAENVYDDQQPLEGYRFYIDYLMGEPAYYIAIESLYSLIQSKGLDTSKPETILLIQKVEK